MAPPPPPNDEVYLDSAALLAFLDAPMEWHAYCTAFKRVFHNTPGSWLLVCLSIGAICETLACATMAYVSRNSIRTCFVVLAVALLLIYLVTLYRALRMFLGIVREQYLIDNLYRVARFVPRRSERLARHAPLCYRRRTHTGGHNEE